MPVCRLLVGTNLQMNALADQMLDQSRIFDAAHAVADSRRLKLAQRFPNAVRAASLAGMRGAIEPVVDRVAKRGNVRINRITGFVAGDIERRHAAAAKLLHQSRGQQALARDRSGAACKE